MCAKQVVNFERHSNFAKRDTLFLMHFCNIVAFCEDMIELYEFLCVFIQTKCFKVQNTSSFFEFFKKLGFADFWSTNDA